MAIAQGTWNWLPFGLGSVDLGLTEKYAPSLGKNPAFAQPIGQESIPQGTQTPYGVATKTTNPTGNVLGTASTNYNVADQSPRPAGYYDVASQSPRPSNYDNLKAIADKGDLNPAQQTEWNNLNQQVPSMQDQVNNAYSGYIASLDQQLGELSGYQNQQNEYIGNQANLSQNLLDTNKTQGLNQLQGYQTEAQSNKAKTLRDIQQDLTNSLQAGQVYLGGMGAGSSSAVGRLSGALAKGANQRTTDVSNQFAKITNDINMQRSNLQSIYDQEVTKLQQWKTEQINNIAQWVQQQRQSLINTKGQVDMQKNMELINMAQQALADVDNQQAQFNQTIQQWAADKATSLDQYMGQIQKMGQYDVPGYTYDPLAGQFVSNARGDVSRRFFGTADEERQY